MTPLRRLMARLPLFLLIYIAVVVTVILLFLGDGRTL